MTICTRAKTRSSDGNPAAMTYLSTDGVAYSYTGRGQLYRITTGGTTLVEYEYDPAGNRTWRKQMPGGLQPRRRGQPHVITQGKFRTFVWRWC